MKLSFLGDIMCEQPFLRAARRSMDFSAAFQKVAPLLTKSDYVVGNLETPFAGTDAGYTSQLYSFNTPDAFLDALKPLNIHLYTTANNHALDRGPAGLCRTLEQMDLRGLRHTGTFSRPEDRRPFFLAEACGLKLAFISYASALNQEPYRRYEQELKPWHINLLAEGSRLYAQTEKTPSARPALYHLRCLAAKMLSEQTQLRIKRFLGLPHNAAYADDYPNDVKKEAWRPLQEDIRAAAQQADFVFFCMHSGGQFNPQPGSFSKAAAAFAIENGCSAVIGTHPHVVQPLAFVSGAPCAYCLGNFSISPSSAYLLADNKPEYSIVLHFYLEKGAPPRVAWSVLKIVEDRRGFATVWPVHELRQTLNKKAQESLEADVAFINKRFCGYVPEGGIRGEYKLSGSVDNL